MKSIYLICLAVLPLLSSVQHTLALEVDDISQCPPLRKTRMRARDVTNLKVNDIEVIAALGDSVTAGMLGRNINTTYIQFDQFEEQRGQSFLMGGDKDAHSIAKYVQHYSPELYGPSIGVKPSRICPETIFCFDALHTPEIDHLNAAQSGATSKELKEQVDYLLDHFGNNTSLTNKWKLINVFIGFNDVSISCVPGRNETEYYYNIQSQLTRLLSNVDYAFVNLVGIVPFNKVIFNYKNQPGYKKKFENYNVDLLTYECYCCTVPGVGPDALAERVDRYNIALKKVASSINKSPRAFGRNRDGISKNIAVAYQPMNIDTDSIPYYALSNVDGYHPNVIGYKYLSTVLWKQMFLKRKEENLKVKFTDSIKVYCPSDRDRLEVPLL